VHFRIQWRVSKNGNSALQPCHFRKYLLTVGSDEQKEIAISPSILVICVVLFFWYVPIRHIGRYLECQNANSMHQSCHNKIGVLTVCHNEQPYLHQNKIFLWCFFGLVITQNKDKHWKDLNRESLGKIKWNVPFLLTCQLVSHSFCIMFRLLS
jgi:hypothetical protein